MPLKLLYNANLTIRMPAGKKINFWLIFFYIIHEKINFWLIFFLHHP